MRLSQKAVLSKLDAKCWRLVSTNLLVTDNLTNAALGMSIRSQQRILLFDDNVRSIGGHFLELASLLIEGAHELGYSTKLATHHSFNQWDDLPSHIDLQPAFHARRLIHWSLGVDGRSYARRDVNGSTIGSEKLYRLWHKVRDPLARRDRQPGEMLRRWSRDFRELVEQWSPGPEDRLLINTGDDFLMLALAKALEEIRIDHPLNIDVVFHFAVFDQANSPLESAEIPRRAIEFGKQVNEALVATAPHNVSLFATTQSLANQLAAVGVSTKAVPYPTRARWMPEPNREQPDRLKLLMAGIPRAEKGRDQMPKLLSSIYRSHLSAGNFCLSMQMPARRWKRMVPAEMRATYRKALAERQSGHGPLEIMDSDLSSDAYHSWLDTAHIGLFLYEPSRYVARCSGVLLEMLVRGIPVIVPANCWLADQIELAGGDGSVGSVYQSIDEIPDLMSQMRDDYGPLRERARQYMQVIANRHDPANTLTQMGVGATSHYSSQVA